MSSRGDSSQLPRQPTLPRIQLRVAGYCLVLASVCESRRGGASNAGHCPDCVTTYSVRNAIVGSMLSARRVGTTQASMQTPSMTIP